VSIDWGAIATEFWNEQPHPRAAGLKIGEFATAVKLATISKFGGHASPQEAELFWPQFKATGLSPEEFTHTIDRLAPLSFTFHGRPPTMKEITELKDKMPHEARKYFADLPDKHHPEITSGDMVKSLKAARPWARQYLGREPVKPEGAYLHHSGSPAAEYYQHLAAQQPPQEDKLSPNGVQAAGGGNAGGRELEPARGSQANQ
jgi:hypothetical protein